MSRQRQRARRRANWRYTVRTRDLSPGAVPNTSNTAHPTPLASSRCGGNHEGFDFPTPETGDRYGLPGVKINTHVIAMAVGACIDSCRPCQQVYVPVLARDPAAATRAVELSAMLVATLLGGVPDSMVTPDGLSTHPDSYRTIVRAGLDGESKRMYEVVRDMPLAARTTAVENALDMITGNLLMS